ncbi:RHS repeat-associated core domain-containing protein, partial [Wandonia haliotis]|uniref:RHS repeat-associated core domain-containing protein n=1 Tax=Wandonia haliotis TaxID=574963 RepID=UPI0031D9CA80
IDGLDVQGTAYRYDQLQRIKEMQVYRAVDVESLFAWTNSAATDEYKTTFSYDRNGNLLSLNRNGIGTELDMDRFVYNYHTLGGQPSNRLNYVVDNGTDYSSYDDIKTGQTTSNYTYNKIGELIEDASEDMELEWRYGDHKLSKITRTDAASPNITFLYTPFGQRAMKLVEGRSGGSLTGDQNFTYYAYDANGQVMAVYEIAFPTDSYKLNERHLYGAERLGVNSEEVTIYQGGNFTSYTHKEEDVVHTEESGHKRYELTNHLGNVLAVINDRKIYNSTDQNYDPVLLSWSDYYAFGMTMPGRNGGVNYRYLFNGMEHDGEVSGNGNSYTTEFRQYDPRLGRWKSLDPLMAKYPGMSPYVAFNNNPIYFVDPFGLEGTPPVETGSENGGDTSNDGDWKYHCDDANSRLDGWKSAQTGRYGIEAKNGLRHILGRLNQKENAIKEIEQRNQQKNEELLRKAKRESDRLDHWIEEEKISQNDVEIISDRIFSIAIVNEWNRNVSENVKNDFDFYLKTGRRAKSDPATLTRARSVTDVNDLVNSVWARPLETGYAESQDWFWSFFITPSSAAFSMRYSSTITSNRVFWSGGNVAKNAAANFARENGMITLEMTITGRVMNTINPILPRSVSTPIWNRLSLNFAKGAKGEAHFFTTSTGPRPTSIWLRVEKPILKVNKVRIINH